MTIKEIIDAERWEDVPTIITARAAHNDSLDRVEAAVTKSVEAYERLLDKAYDDFQDCADNWEVREVLKELIEYAPRKNWEEK